MTFLDDRITDPAEAEARLAARKWIDAARPHDRVLSQLEPINWAARDREREQDFGRPRGRDYQHPYPWGR